MDIVHSLSPRNVGGLAKIVEKVVHAKISPSRRYLISTLIALSGVVVAALLKKYTGMVGVPYTILATVLAATVGGYGPGILAAVISAVGSDIFVVEPIGFSGFGWYGFTRLFVFTLISGLVSFLVSALRASISKAEQAREKAERANSEKDAVIEFLSHDLRGPLSSISLSFQLMQKYADSAGKEREISRLSSNGVFFCHRMAQLIQNLLDASRIKSGGITLIPKSHDMREIINEVLVEHRLLAEEKRISLAFSEEAGESVSVNCDRILISQVLANLIQNAFKFTPQGGKITVGMEEVGSYVQLEVRDTGQGIPSAQLPHIFEKFWQAKKLTGEGAGLGLFISRAIIEAHRGEISAQSQAGKGTSIRLLIPKTGAEMGSGEVGRVSLCSSA